MPVTGEEPSSAWASWSSQCPQQHRHCSQGCSSLCALASPASLGHIVPAVDGTFSTKKRNQGGGEKEEKREEEEEGEEKEVELVRLLSQQEHGMSLKMGSV